MNNPEIDRDALAADIWDVFSDGVYSNFDVADALIAAGYRKVEAAPSDTDTQTIDLDAVRLLLDTWSGEDDQRLFATVNWQLIRANYRALLEVARLTPAQPVQVEVEVEVEVTDEMVARAGRFMYAFWDEWAEEDIQAAGIHDHLREVLEAALGGGDHE